MGGLPLSIAGGDRTWHPGPALQGPWCMHLVLHVPRQDPPCRAALCSAAATAVARLLADPRSADGGPWSERVHLWSRGPIRKLARRARGVDWDRVQTLEGVTAEHDGAQVRALVPMPRDAPAGPVARLPLTWSEPPVLGPTQVEPRPDGPIVVSITTDPPVPLGKAAAAAGHAAQLALTGLPPGRRDRWAEHGFPVLVAHPAPDRWRTLRATAGLRVLDGGLTVVAPGTCTAVITWR